MNRKRTLTVIVVIALFALPLAAQTAQTTRQYQPSVGQEGKDVIWVPTPESLVQAMLDLAKLTPSDYLIDLGSGDGRIVIAAAKRGTRALGVEFNPDMVELSRQNAAKEGVSDKATFVRGDIFEADFSKATVLTMYLLPSLNMRLRPQILQMKPGTRVVTHAFTMEDWEPDQSVSAEERNAYLWIVPAHVEGVWTWREPSSDVELTLHQTFQKIEGTLRSSGRQLAIQNAKLTGDRISFTVGADPQAMQEYSGRVTGEGIDGITKAVNRAGVKWAARHRTAQ
jgi:hypothetical protein